MPKLKSKVEICKLSATTPVFLPRYREARKLPPSPRWSPSQGISNTINVNAEAKEQGRDMQTPVDDSGIFTKVSKSAQASP